MNIPNRRDFIRQGGTTLIAGALSPRLFAGAAATRPGSGRATPMIHATDLFHLHGDPDASVFSFRPVDVQCDDRGITTWKPDEQARNRFILHIADVGSYQKAMTLALKNLLLQLPA